MRQRICRTLLLPAIAVCGFVAILPGGTLAAESDWEMRVESRVFREDDEQPISRSLALFANDVVWDFLELADEDGALQLVEIVLHDPLRERTVLVDPRRHVKVEVDKLKLDRLRVSLASWARGADDPVIRWAASSTAVEGLHLEHEPHPAVVLSGPKVRYVVAYEKATSAEAAASYQKFADVSLLLKALVHPGGLPPFPRLAINRALAEEQAIPSEVRLTLAGDLPLVGGLPGVSGEKLLRSEHRSHTRLLAEDRRRIAEASARAGESSLVPLEIYANPQADGTTAIASEPSEGGSVRR